MEFTQATRTQARVRMAIQGPSGSGKTCSGIEIAEYLTPGKVRLLDTENGSASKHALLPGKTPGPCGREFKVLEIRDNNYHPDKVMQAIAAAHKAGIETLVIDSMTHFWNAQGGFLDLVDEEAKRQAAQYRSGKADGFAAWKVVTPIYNRMVHAIQNAPIHVIVTMRSKQEYSREGGKVTKLGMAPEMRDAFQFECDIEGSMDMENTLAIGKSRCPELTGKLFHRPGKNVADILLDWCGQGAPYVPTDWAAEIAAATTLGELTVVGGKLRGDTAALQVHREAFMARKAELGGAANAG